MPTMGEIHVRVSADTAGAAARWLRSALLPHVRRRGDTVLTLGHSAEIARDLERLAAILAKSAARKRRAGTFSINVPRPLVERFAGVAGCWRWPLPLAIADMLAAMIEAVRSRRGRPSLTGRQRSDRIAIAHAVSERHRKRLASRARLDQAWSDWSAEVRRRGETVLTTTVPSPKI